MNCLTAFVLSCLFEPSNLYLTGQVQFALDQANYGRRWCRTDWCNDKVAELRIGMVVELSSSFQVDYGLLHRSFYDTPNDKGEESAFLSLTWRPFR